MDAEFKGEPLNPIQMLGEADKLCTQLLGEVEAVRLANLRQLKLDNPTMHALVVSRMQVLREIANPKIEVVLVYRDHTQHTFKVPGKEPPKVVLMNSGVLPRVFALRTNNYYDEVTPAVIEPPKPRKV